MLASPAVGPHPAAPSVGRADAQVFDEALAEADERGDGDDDGDEVLAATAAVGTFGSRAVVREEHAERDEKVGDYLGVRREDIREEDVAEFTIVRGGEAADGDAAEGGEKPGSSRRGEAANWKDE